MSFSELFGVLLLKLAAVMALTVAIIGGVALSGHHVAYWAALLMASLLVLAGIAVFDSDWID